MQTSSHITDNKFKWSFKRKMIVSSFPYEVKDHTNVEHSNEATAFTTSTRQIGELVLRIQVGKQILLKEGRAAELPFCLGQI